METFQQPKITGYRQLTEDEVALMNEAKALAEECGVYVSKLRQMGLDTGSKIDQRWVSIGATDLQTGFMALVRAVARPTSF